jgi:8-oxo-dGTP pyrophosphatase MutT (NUDIX family)
MHRNLFLQGLIDHHQRVLDPDEAAALEKTIAFVRSTPECYERSHQAGHITGSALVVSLEKDAVLLTHHKKLNKWLQLGGHSDGHPLTWEVALREAEEESGLAPLTLFGSTGEWQSLRSVWSRWGDRPSVKDADQDLLPPYLPFDVDVHEIPARRGEPHHLHYDVRYLIFADQTVPLGISDESHDLKWVPLREVPSLTNEPSMIRMLSKVNQYFVASAENSDRGLIDISGFGVTV